MWKVDWNGLAQMLASEERFGVLRQGPSYYLIGGIVSVLLSGFPGSGTWVRAWMFYGGLICVIYGLVGLGRRIAMGREEKRRLNAEEERDRVDDV